MRLISRRDTPLAVALIAATWILFQQPLRFILNAVEEVGAQYHLDLIPALTLLTVVFVFHAYAKHHEAKTAARLASLEAAQARRKSQQLEQLTQFAEALAHALDFEALREVLCTHLPRLSHRHPGSVLLRRRNHWEPLLGVAPDDAFLNALDQLGRRGLPEESHRANHQSIAVGREVWIPLIAAGAPVGGLSVPSDPPMTDEEATIWTTAAALLALSIRNVQAFAATREHSRLDELTGCVNRASGLEILDAELRRVRRSDSPLSILMFDLDQFKAVNDEFGHLRGDEVLQRVGTTLAQKLRLTDTKCRYGGDEFLVILPNTPLQGAQHVADALRDELAAHPIAAGDRRLPLTISIGATEACPSDRVPQALLERADTALYQAKRAGRNQCCTARAGGEPSAVPLALAR